MATSEAEPKSRTNWIAVFLILLALAFIAYYAVEQLGINIPISEALDEMTVGGGNQQHNVFVAPNADSTPVPTPFQPLAPTPILSPACPEAGAVMLQYRKDEEGEHWFNSTVRWSPGMPLGVKFPELLVQQFGKPETRSPEQAEKFAAYTQALVKLGENLNPGLNWLQRLQDFLNAYIDFEKSTCFRFPTDSEVAVYGETTNWGLPDEMTGSTAGFEPGPMPDIAPPPGSVPPTEPEVAATQQVVVVDPNKPGQQTTWDWVPVGPPAPTPTLDLMFELPPLQGPGITPQVMAISVDDLMSRSWAVPLVIEGGQCPDINLSAVTLVPDGDNMLGLSYVVDFSSWAEFCVGPCKKVRLVHESTWVNQEFIQRGENKMAGFSEQVSVYIPPASTPVPEGDNGVDENITDIDLGTLARDYGRSGIAADLSCNGDSVIDFGRVVFRNSNGTFATKLLIYMGNYVGPCSAIEITYAGEKPGMSMWGVDGMVLVGFKDAFNLTPMGPPAP